MIFTKKKRLVGEVNLAPLRTQPRLQFLLANLKSNGSKEATKRNQKWKSLQSGDLGSVQSLVVVPENCLIDSQKTSLHAEQLGNAGQRILAEFEVESPSKK